MKPTQEFDPAPLQFNSSNLESAVSKFKSKNLDYIPLTNYDLSVSSSSLIVPKTEREGLKDRTIFDNFKKHEEIDITGEYSAKDELLRESQIYSRRGKYEEYDDKSNKRLNVEF